MPINAPLPILSPATTAAPVAPGSAIRMPVLPMRKKITVSGSIAPDVDGEYFEKGEWTSLSPGFPVFTKDDVTWNEFLSISRIAFNGVSWALEHFDMFGEIDAIWFSNFGPAPASPELATAWTPDGNETGTLVVTATDVPADMRPTSCLPPSATSNPIAPTPII